MKGTGDSDSNSSENDYKKYNSSDDEENSKKNSKNKKTESKTEKAKETKKDLLKEAKPMKGTDAEKASENLAFAKSYPLTHLPTSDI